MPNDEVSMDNFQIPQKSTFDIFFLVSFKTFLIYMYYLVKKRPCMFSLLWTVKIAMFSERKITNSLQVLALTAADPEKIPSLCCLWKRLSLTPLNFRATKDMKLHKSKNTSKACFKSTGNLTFSQTQCTYWHPHHTRLTLARSWT